MCCTSKSGICVAVGTPRSPTTSAQWISPGLPHFICRIEDHPSYIGSTPVFYCKLKKFLWHGPLTRTGRYVGPRLAQPCGPRLPVPAPSTCQQTSNPPVLFCFVLFYFPDTLPYHRVSPLTAFLSTGGSGTSNPILTTFLHLPIYHVRQVQGGDHPRGRRRRRQARGSGASRW